MPKIDAPSASFKENLDRMPPVDGVDRIELVDAAGSVVGVIENRPGQIGSVAVYGYLARNVGKLNAEAAMHGLAIYGEHTQDARQRPGAHPNIDRLLDLAGSDQVLTIRTVPRS